MPENVKHNRLNNEKSPYLLQHADNPVDWYPWTEEAFNTARKENKPIFLSIGYSTCHWCHVNKMYSIKMGILLLEYLRSFMPEKLMSPLLAQGRHYV